MHTLAHVYIYAHTHTPQWEESFHNAYQITMISTLNILKFCQLHVNKALKKNYYMSSGLSLGRKKSWRGTATDFIKQNLSF